MRWKRRKQWKREDGNVDINNGEREEVVVCGCVQFLLHIQHHPQFTLHPIPDTVRVRDLNNCPPNLISCVPIAQSDKILSHQVRRSRPTDDRCCFEGKYGWIMSREAVEDEKRW